MAAAARDPRLKKRTLTNLYNQRPTWLKLAHEQLDRSILAAYKATDPAANWSEDFAAVWTDSGAGQPLPDDHPFTQQTPTSRPPNPRKPPPPQPHSRAIP